VTEGLIQRIELAFEYPVKFTNNVFDPANVTLIRTLARCETRCHRVAVIIDDGVAAQWPKITSDIEQYAHAHCERMQLAHPLLTIAGGERSKRQRQLLTLHRHLADLKIDRQSFVLAIGGGAALDVIGYAAATLHRGVRLVRMPSTVLAQSDAGVGVKNGINAFGAKNFLGTFAAPFAVINDCSLLSTLQHRDKVAGMAEAVKVALIRDRTFFEWIGDHAAALAAFHPRPVAYLVRRTAQLHLEHIGLGGDPFEQNNVRPLDFGHWAAHKLETLTNYALRHGEAVAIGIALDSAYSLEAGHLTNSDFATIITVLQCLTLPIFHPQLQEPALIDGLAEFREHLGGDLCITLLRAPGSPMDANHLELSTVHRAIARLAAAHIALPA
jgi:3-dehydroquinate synthase